MGTLAVLGALMLCCGVGQTALASEIDPTTLAINRRFEVLPAPAAGDWGPPLRAAARQLGSWKLELSGVEVDEARLLGVLDSGDPELERALRVQFKRALDLEDFLYFLDDVLVAGKRGLRGRDVVVTSGRARSAGILIHPDEVFRKRPRRYGERQQSLAIDRPEPQQAYAPAEDGEVLGPRWTGRYPNPATSDEMLSALEGTRPQSRLASRIRDLMGQLERQGAVVFLTSTLRRRERGYLMWGAFLLSRAANANEGSAIQRKLARANREWKLGIPIRWQHPEGWPATQEAARVMAEAYEVVYATEEGARASNHYDGVAVDFVAVGLPDRLTLEAPDGAKRTFDLSSPEQTRDLSLSPTLIEWIELHYELLKLRSDYPHWDDARKVESPRQSGAR